MKMRVDELLKMEEYFKSIGDTETYKAIKDTAKRLCDYILFVETYQPKSEACVKQKSQGHRRGAEYYAGR